MRFVTLRQIVYFLLSPYSATRVTTGFSLWFIVLNCVTDSAVGIVLFALTALRSTSPSVLRDVSHERAAHVPRAPKEPPPVGYRVRGINLYRFVTAVTDPKHVTAPCGRTQRNRITWRVFVCRVSGPVSGSVSTRADDIWRVSVLARWARRNAFVFKKLIDRTEERTVRRAGFRTHPYSWLNSHEFIISYYY